jgi:GntR family transcriptional regulator
MGPERALIRFRLDPHTGVPAYRQLVDQVDQAIRLGLLGPGDQLPSVRDVVTQISINPNTVHRAYRELEHLALVEARPGLGTFVVEHVAPATTPRRQAALSEGLGRWVAAARGAGLNDDAIRALVARALQEDDPREEETT